MVFRVYYKKEPSFRYDDYIFDNWVIINKIRILQLYNNKNEIIHMINLDEVRNIEIKNDRYI
jgi:hypothetical protein